MRGYNPWHDLADRYPGVHVELASICGTHAAWSPEHRVILVCKCLDVVGRRTALAHEIAHIDAGDRDAGAGWLSVRQEAAADQLAARRLIAVDDLAETARWCTDARELAAELGVTVELLMLRIRTLHPAERGVVEAVRQRRERAA